MGSGGGDSGAADREEQRRMDEEARARAAVDRINSLFGIGGDTSMSAPNAADYMQTAWTDGTRLPTRMIPNAGPYPYGGYVQDGMLYYSENPNPEQAGYSTSGGKFTGMSRRDVSVLPSNNNQYYQTSILNNDAYNAAMQAYQRGNAARSRNQLYDTVRNDTFNFHKQRLDDDRTQAERALRFQLARQGQFGGSLDLDQNSELSKGYNNGLLDVRNLSDAARNDALARDDQTRIDLINRVNAGMDEQSAIASANSQMQSNINQARDNALSQSLGNAFANVALLKNQYDFQQGMNDIRNRNNNYFPQTGNNGTIRS